MNIESKIKLIKKEVINIKDFPIKGINFKDVTPLISNPKTLKTLTNILYKKVKNLNIDGIAALESRGFWFGLPLAYKMNLPFFPIRKPGKLPRKTIESKYKCEYGHNIIQIHKGDIKPGMNILIVDDLIATGGSALAAIDLIEKSKANIIALATIINLEFLNGSKKIEEKGNKIISLINFGK